MNRKVIISRLRYQALGLVFVLVAALFVSGTIAVYNKAFTDVVAVRLEVPEPGSQLSVGADVKVRGIEVGRVGSIEPAAEGASLTLELQPDRVGEIPANVRALILPKTLFGQRYVSLRIPDEPDSGHVEAGDVITKDRSDAAIELETVLTDVVPLLKAVEPEKLSSTLHAISSALEGRGQQLGDTLAQVSELLGEVDDSLPDIKADIDKFADVADTYDDITPDVLRGLSDLTTTTQTMVEKRDDLNQLYASVLESSVDLRRFLEVNKDNLIRLTGEVQPTLDVLAEYAPEYPCLLNQIAESVPNARETFGAGSDHPKSNKVMIEMIPGGKAYEPGEDEHVNAEDRGPRCYPLPAEGKNFPQYPPGGPIQDGTSESAEHEGEGLEMSQPVQGLGAPFQQDLWDDQGSDEESDTDAGGGSGAMSSAGVPSIANSPAEQDLLSVLLAPQLDVAVGEVPGWSSLLVGPLYRGKEVELQ